MEHALHLAAKPFIKGVAPKLASKLLEKVKGTMDNATRDDEVINCHTLNMEIGEIEAEMGANAKEGDDEQCVSNTIGKDLTLITQVYIYSIPIYIAHL